MNPTDNLREQQNLGDRPDYGYQQRRLAELRRSLRDWLQTGGVEPDWSAYPEASRDFNAWRQRLTKVVR